MAKEGSTGLTKHHMKVTISMERNMARAYSIGQTGHSIRASSTRTTLRDKDSISGQMVAYIMVFGSIIKCTVKAFSRGLMAVATKEAMSRIRSRVTEPLSGPMARSTWVIGLMADSMAVEYISCPLVRKEKANGLMEKE